ncbi:MAG: HAMP domain-containing sensor histidine kinase [Pseudomonadota bacterium]
MLTRISHSLSAKLILLFICAGAVLLLMAGSIMGKGFTRHFRQSVQPFVVHYVELMEEELGIPPDRERAEQITREIPVDIHVFGPEDSWTTAARILDPEELKGFQKSAEVKLKRFGELSQRYNIRRIDEQLILETTSGPYKVYFQISDQSGLRRGGPYGLILIGLILAILSLIYLATRALFRPIQDIRDGVKRIGAGELEHRIVKQRDDQLGDLTDSVNAMADDISEMLEAKRQMLLGISHELRSPLTRSRLNLELLPESSSADEVKKDIAAMDELITELLESEKLNSRHATLQREFISVDQLVEDLLNHEFANTKIDSEIDTVNAEVDPMRIKLLLRNLLTNAIKYSPVDSSPPHVTLSKTDEDFFVSVRDYGSGIEKEHIRHLTEPFYRADPSRQRKTGGYGLGLYLCRMIVEAHQGSLTIDSQLQEGTTISCQIPL